jgi:sulfonate transport system permease protein
MSITENVTTFITEKYKGFITLLVLFAIWVGVSHFKLVSAESLPSPQVVGGTFLKLLLSGLLGKSLGMSMIRITEGFLIGCSLGFLFGAVMGISRTAERLLAPLINAIRQVPIIGWIPLIIVWCGIADMSKITFIAIGAFFPMVLNTFDGVRAVSNSYVEVGRVFEFGKLEMLRKIVIPAALPNIVTGIRLSLGTAWMLVVWSEINTRSDFGIGDMLWSARESSKMDVIIVCIIVIGVVAFLINELIGQIEARLSTWKKTYR